MKHQKNLHYFFLLALLLFLSQNIGISQTAVCKSQITVSTDPWSCSYTLLPSDINNGSTDFDVLTIDKTNLTVLGPHVVTLTASNNSGQSSTCTCTVNLADKSAPVAIAHENVTVTLNDQNVINIPPSLVDNGSFDQCSNVSLSVSPSLIDCSSPNPLKVTLTVTDAYGNYNQVFSYINIVQNKNRIKAVVCKGDITFGVPSKGVFEITADSLLEGGPYGCPYYYDVELKYNNFLLPEPKVGPSDVGKTFDYKVTDPETQNFCTGKITIIALDCSNALSICDTQNRCTAVGDCNSGHTITDDIEWPCDITIDNAPSYLYISPSPQKIADFLQVAIGEVKPVLFNGLPNNNKCLQVGENYHSVVNEFQNEIRFIYSVINWQDVNQETYSFTQVITLIPENDLKCLVCDNKPWNTPFGDCASGHTMDDYVEWPADITVDFLEVSPYDLSLNPLIHPNDVAPGYNDSCSVIWLKSYSDLVTEINSFTYLIERTWTILNTKSLQIYNYVQKININIPVTNNRNICFSTIHNTPIANVEIMPGVDSGTEMCSTVSYDSSMNDIKPFKKDTDFQTGLDVEDIIILKESVLRQIPLLDMQKLAADMNKDEVINNADVTILNNLLTNKISVNPFYTSPWKFLLANDYFYKNTIADETGIDSPFENYHFKGMKLGDLNDSYNRDEGIAKVTYFALDDQILNQGETYSVKTFIEGDLRIKGMQLAIKKNDAFDITAVLSPFLNLELIDKGDYYLILGLIDDTYIKSEGFALENQTSVLKMIIKAKQNVVLHDVMKLYDSGNKMVQGSNRGVSLIQLNYMGTIPTSVLDFYQHQIAVFPNPSAGLINVTSPKETINVVKIMSFDGKCLQTTSDLSSGTIDISHLPNGFYTVNISLNNGLNIVKKLIKI